MASAAYNLMRNQIDYAGLFPPAGLAMPTVVENYAKYLDGNDHHALGRLIVPATRLVEFAEAAKQFLPSVRSESQSIGSGSWKISGLVPPSAPDSDDFKNGVQLIREFNARHAQPENGLACVDRVELKAPTIEHIQTAAECDGLPIAFLELPHEDVPEQQIKTIAKLTADGHQGLRAKIRTGGLTENLIPSPEQVAGFIHCCAQHKVAFKATAGLHHPLRNEFPLTYEKDSDVATMHGFLNVFIASVAAFSQSISPEKIAEILQLNTAEQISFEEDSIKVVGLSISSQQVHDARTTGIASFGSCSFAEPTTEFKSHFGQATFSNQP